MTAKDDHCKQESRITAVEEKIKTLSNNDEELKETLTKVDETQNKLAVSIAELNSTFASLKWAAGIVIALFGGIASFLIIELIKFV